MSFIHLAAALARQEEVMSSARSLDNYLEYGKTLVDSGTKGIRSGAESYLHGQSLSAALGESARTSLPFAAIGIGAGLLQLIAGGRRHRMAKTVTAMVAGAGLGFLVGFSWKSRELAGSMAHDVLKNVGVTRDAHWLERHPITYA
jgi:hypothetical protein